MPMSSLFVPTAETSSLRFFLDLMVNLKKPIMFVGGAGVGMSLRKLHCQSMPAHRALCCALVDR